MLSSIEKGLKGTISLDASGCGEAVEVVAISGTGQQTSKKTAGERDGLSGERSIAIWSPYHIRRLNVSNWQSPPLC